MFKFRFSSFVLFLTFSIIGQSQNQISIPEILTGAEINLQIAPSEKEFFPGIMTKTYGYNGNYLGKTIILNKGQKVKLNVINALSETTTTHWHGLHVAPINDGSPHNPIIAGDTWSPEFTVMDKAGTYWYHPHLHEKTLKQVVKGAAGLIIVRDDEETALKLPRKYGVDDFPLICQFQTFDSNKQIVEEDESDNTILLNGTVNGHLDVPSQMVRLRLLNASSHRVFRFGFDGNLSFYQITSDAGLLNKPVKLTRLNLGSGERAEIIVDLSILQGKTIKLKTFGNELPIGYPGGPAMMGMAAGPLDNKTSDVLTLNVVEKTVDPVLEISQSLTTNVVWPQSNTTNRPMGFTAQPMMSMTNFFINNKKFDEKVINFKTKLNNTEIWTLTNQTMMAHPFHIHGNHFYVLSINGQAPPENMAGRKDVVLVPPMNGSVQLIMKYEDFVDSEIPYMYHCHILSHEDGGMMGQFVVTDLTSITDDDKLNQGIKVNLIPNPANNFIELSCKTNSDKLLEVLIYDIQGKLMFHKNHVFSNEQSVKVDISEWSLGNYYIKIVGPTFNEMSSFIKY